MGNTANKVASKISTELDLQSKDRNQKLETLNDNIKLSFRSFDDSLACLGKGEPIAFLDCVADDKHYKNAYKIFKEVYSTENLEYCRDAIRGYPNGGASGGKTTRTFEEMYEYYEFSKGSSAPVNLLPGTYYGRWKTEYENSTPNIKERKAILFGSVSEWTTS